jgi:hypothetical protein
VFEVCMLDLGCINQRVSGSDKGEEEGEEDRDTKRST